MGIERFEDLKSWQEARKLDQIVFRLTSKDPFRHDKGLTWQILDAAASVMGNVAESHGRYSFEDKRRFLDIAMGSSREIQSHLYVASDRRYIDEGEFKQAYDQAELVAQLLAGSIKNIDRQIGRRSTDKPSPRRKPRSN